MEQKGLKVLVHASAFYMPFLIPLFIFLIIDDHEVKKTAVQAVLFQIAMGVLVFISFLLIFIVIGIPMIIVFGIMWVVVPILAIIKTLNGEDYNYPIVGSFYK